MTFDTTDPKNMGRPLFWDLQAHIAAVESLIRSDEIEMALKLCRMVPAWYLEPGNYPRELTAIKETLWRQLYSAYDYANDFDEANYTLDECYRQFDQGYFFPRANLLGQEIKVLNDKGEVPWFHELSPSHGAMVLGLLRLGLKFKFFGQNLNSKALDRLREWLPKDIWQDAPTEGQVKIIASFESLEHMWRETDIEQAAGKLGHTYDIVALSVPFCCLGGGLENYKTRRLGHIRGYNSKQFIDMADRMFQGYSWAYTKHASQVLIGKRA